jgi:hypothetical protein
MKVSACCTHIFGNIPYNFASLINYNIHLFRCQIIYRYKWVCVCVGFCNGRDLSCVLLLVICVLVFTVFFVWLRLCICYLICFVCTATE